MAQIVPSKAAPSEEVNYGFATTKPFSLGPGGSYETTDRAVLGEANAHPWLDVVRDEGEKAVAHYRDDSVNPKDDALSAQNSVAFDKEKIAEALRSDEDADEGKLAVESGQKQTTRKSVGEVATTLAADDAKGETK